jgi:hypothetical protein
MVGLKPDCANRGQRIMKLLLSVVMCCLVGAATHAEDAAPAVWDEIRIGLPLDDVTQRLRDTHANATLTRADGSGYRKFWPVDRRAIAAANEIERAYFPHGHVLILDFDRERIITGTSRTFVSEQAYEDSLNSIQRPQ